ncbi:AAA family ATPase [Nocardioides lacusdianchii]|uniref:AAA family ATPase n=1 Tax=Nocardioides lacusdianchii TaxID=2783664 RepID=UPI001CCDB53B|nr:AAA family ATPase [Nocardioides lacusdianchii]
MPEVWFEGLTLRSWRLGNFKSVREATVQLAPLTVVVGGNSAGKSTLLQSIRVASQAANSDLSVFPLNGEQFRPGTFAETRFAGAEEAEPIEIGGEFNLGPFRSGYFERSTNAGPYVNRHRPRRRRDEDVKLSWHLNLHGTPADQSAATNVQAVKVTASQGEELHVELTVNAIRGARDRGFGRDQRYTGTVNYGEHFEPVEDVSLSGGFPQELLREVDLANDLFWKWQETQSLSVRSNVSRLAGSEERAEPREVDEGVLVDRIVSDLRKAVDDSPQAASRHTAERLLSVRLRELIYSDPVSVSWTTDLVVKVATAVSERLGWHARGTRSMSMPDLMDDALDEVRFFLANRVQHLGPLRMDPQVVYRSSPASQPGFIGAKGEYSASVLQTSGRQMTSGAPMPPDWSAPRHHRPTLSQAVNAWAAHLGIGDSFETTDQGRLGLQLFVKQPDVDIELDLTSVGTGVSQLLPVLVMCLHAPPGSLLLIEQPELHLNPGVQQRLADFFLAIARSGRQLLLETHSDYLVSRLRLRAAEDDDESTQELIRVVFAERTNGVTSYHEAAPARDGSMATWPAGFFEEAAHDSYALLTAMLERRDDHG